MFTAHRATAIALPVVLIFTMGGCALLDPTGDADQLTGIAACALGHTWTLDTPNLADQVKTQLTKEGVPGLQNVVGSGSQTLEWSVEGHVSLDTDYTLTITSAPAADQLLTVAQAHSGKITGAAYINGDVAIPRKWNASDFSVDVSGDNNGTAIDPAAPAYTLPITDFDDSVGLELTCNGDALTIHPRGGKYTLTYAKTD